MLELMLQSEQQAMADDIVGKAAVRVIRAKATVADAQSGLFADAVTERDVCLPGEVGLDPEAADIRHTAEEQFLGQVPLRAGVRGEGGIDLGLPLGKVVPEK